MKTFRVLFTSLNLAALVIGLTSCGDGHTFTAPPPPIATNTAPSFTSNSAADVSENTSQEVLYTAKATDAENDTLTFSISGGADRALFTIDGSSGQLRLVASAVALNFEKPADTDGDNIYEIILQVSDGKATVDLPISLTVLNVVESKIMRLSGTPRHSADILPVGDFTGDGTADILLFENTLVSANFFGESTGQPSEIAFGSLSDSDVQLTFVRNDGLPVSVRTAAFDRNRTQTTYLRSATRQDIDFNYRNNRPKTASSPQRGNQYIAFSLDASQFDSLNGTYNLDAMPNGLGRTFIKPFDVETDPDGFPGFEDFIQFALIPDITGDGIADFEYQLRTDLRSWNTFYVFDGAALLDSTTDITTFSQNIFNIETELGFPAYLVAGGSLVSQYLQGDLDGDGIDDVASELFYLSTQLEGVREFEGFAPRTFFDYSSSSRSGAHNLIEDLNDDGTPEVLVLARCACDFQIARSTLISGRPFIEDTTQVNGNVGLVTILRESELQSDERVHINYTGVAGVRGDITNFRDLENIGDIDGNGVDDYAVLLLESRGTDAEQVSHKVFILEGQVLNDSIAQNNIIEINDSIFPNLVTLEFNPTETRFQFDSNFNANLRFQFDINSPSIETVLIRTIPDVDGDGLQELVFTNHLAIDKDVLGSETEGADTIRGESYFIPGAVLKEKMESGGGTIIPKDEL